MNDRLNFQEAHERWRESNRQFEPDVKRVYEVDNQYQNASGGTRTSSLTPEAEEALQHIFAKRKAAGAKILRPYIEAGREEDERLNAELRQAAEHFLDLSARKANFENGFNHLLRLGDEPAQTSVAAGVDRVNAAEVLDRIQRLEARRVAEEKPRRAALALPSFADLFR